MRRFLAVAGVLLAGCDKGELAAVAPGSAAAGKTLNAVPMPVSPSFGVWCSRLSNGTCKGEWDGHAPGVSALGSYRFVLVEYAGQRDGEGPARDVLFELKTSRGVAYQNLGRTRSGKVTTSVMVKEVVDRPGALELRVVFRNAPRFAYSDYYSSSFILEGPGGLAVVEVPLGKIVGDINTGNSTGNVGQAQWRAGTLSLKGTAAADGEWAVAQPR